MFQPDKRTSEIGFEENNVRRRHLRLTVCWLPPKKPNPTNSRLSPGMLKLAGVLVGEWHTEEEIRSQTSAGAAVWVDRGPATGLCLCGCHPPSTISTAFLGCPYPAKVPEESSCHIKSATCDTLCSQIHYPPPSGSDAYTLGQTQISQFSNWLQSCAQKKKEKRINVFWYCLKWC